MSAYEEVLDRIAAEELRANVALKLTHLGLEIDEELAYANMTRLLGKGSFIRIDMEQSQFVDATVRIYRRLRHDGFDNVGTVLQAYLYRTPDDLDSLLSARAEPAARQGRVPRAGGHRVSAQGRRRRGVRASRGAHALGHRAMSRSRRTTRS